MLIICPSCYCFKKWSQTIVSNVHGFEHARNDAITKNLSEELRSTLIYNYERIPQKWECTVYQWPLNYKKKKGKNLAENKCAIQLIITYKYQYNRSTAIKYQSCCVINASVEREERLFYLFTHAPVEKDGVNSRPNTVNAGK